MLAKKNFLFKFVGYIDRHDMTEICDWLLEHAKLGCWGYSMYIPNQYRNDPDREHRYEFRYFWMEDEKDYTFFCLTWADRLKEIRSIKVINGNTFDD